MRYYQVDLELAASIARRRRALGWTQQALAEAIDGHEKLVSAWETRRLGLSPESRTRVEAALSRAEQGQHQTGTGKETRRYSAKRVSS